MERFIASRHGWSLRHCENPIRIVSSDVFFWHEQKIKKTDKTSNNRVLFREIIGI
jgi:hypothetical protein